MANTLKEMMYFIIFNTGVLLILTMLITAQVSGLRVLFAKENINPDNFEIGQVSVTSEKYGDIRYMSDELFLFSYPIKIAIVVQNKTARKSENITFCDIQEKISKKYLMSPSSIPSFYAPEVSGSYYVVCRKNKKDLPNIES